MGKQWLRSKHTYRSVWSCQRRFSLDGLEWQRSYHLWNWTVEEQNDWSIYGLVRFRWMTIRFGSIFIFCWDNWLLSSLLRKQFSFCFDVLKFLQVNRILFLWLDFMSISSYSNFYLRAFLCGKYFWFLFFFILELLSFGEYMKVMLLPLLLITASQIFRWAEIDADLLESELCEWSECEYWAVYWLFSILYFHLPLLVLELKSNFSRFNVDMLGRNKIKCSFVAGWSMAKCLFMCLWYQLQ